MNKNPAYQWYPKDFRSDPVFNCSLEAQGLWRNMIDMMFLYEPRGYLESNGKPLADNEIAKFCACPPRSYRRLLAELQAAGAAKTDSRGVIYSKRFVSLMTERASYVSRQKDQRAKPAPAIAPGFDEFYKAYPKKPGPAEARKSWKKIRAEEVPAIMAALEHQKQSQAWHKDGGQFIPMPSTWLNQRRWEGEIFEPEGSHPRMLSDIAAEMGLDSNGNPIPPK